MDDVYIELIPYTVFPDTDIATDIASDVQYRVDPDRSQPGCNWLHPEHCLSVLRPLRIIRCVQYSATHKFARSHGLWLSRSCSSRFPWSIRRKSQVAALKILQA